MVLLPFFPAYGYSTTWQIGRQLFTFKKSVSIITTSFYRETFLNNERLKLPVHPGHGKSSNDYVHSFITLFNDQLLSIKFYHIPDIAVGAGEKNKIEKPQSLHLRQSFPANVQQMDYMCAMISIILAFTEIGMARSWQAFSPVTFSISKLF